ncbi:hypothetical protein AG1IA_00819 [Rhizoctonia solani AG-1 IA]|uniref:Uncharacterized protein n=1 Tax=Thanatephorus cucumeris (strain AG1-IA) TaxID=983506 RepID=L8X4L5_THACA|nr:hypothetical protein AG1IA_00819 [Rhizoctonia solani AG-1 IA]
MKIDMHMICIPSSMPENESELEVIFNPFFLAVLRRSVILPSPPHIRPLGSDLRCHDTHTHTHNHGPVLDNIRTCISRTQRPQRKKSSQKRHHTVRPGPPSLPLSRLSSFRNIIRIACVTSTACEDEPEQVDRPTDYRLRAKGSMCDVT